MVALQAETRNVAMAVISLLVGWGAACPYTTNRVIALYIYKIYISYPNIKWEGLARILKLILSIIIIINKIVYYYCTQYRGRTHTSSIFIFIMLTTKKTYAFYNLFYQHLFTTAWCACATNHLITLYLNSTQAPTF